MIREIFYYQKQNGEYPVENFLDELDKKTKAKIFSVFDIVQNQQFVPTKWLKKWLAQMIFGKFVLNGSQISIDS
jgi:hypothetical protein